jgi:hypothetical protein
LKWYFIVHAISQARGVKRRGDWLELALSGFTSSRFPALSATHAVICQPVPNMAMRQLPGMGFGVAAGFHCFV